jgi:competence protein ComEC
MRACLALAIVAALQAKPLEIFFIDTEGGQATLIVSPSGQSLLVGAGFTNFSGRDADRILAAAKQAHVKHLDAVLIPDHHPEEEGGVPNLIERFTAGTFYDAGPTTDAKPDRTNKAYEAAMEKQHRETVKPGDSIAVKGIEVMVVAAGGKHIDRAGAANPFCAGLAPRAGEDSRSVGIVVEYGKFRFADLGDLAWNQQVELLCPENRVGKVDLLLAPGHGADAPKAIQAVAPRVAIINNGARKGGDPAGFKVNSESPGLQDLWQLHFAMAGGEAANVPDLKIANIEEHCAGLELKVTAESSGEFTVFNPRNKYSKSYKP